MWKMKNLSIGILAATLVDRVACGGANGYTVVKMTTRQLETTINHDQEMMIALAILVVVVVAVLAIIWATKRCMRAAGIAAAERRVARVAERAAQRARANAEAPEIVLAEVPEIVEVK
eukprot:956414_1